MKEKLTEKLLDQLPAAAANAGRQILCYDASQPRFGVIAAASGAVSYFVQYRMGGRGTPSKRLVIGRRGDLTLDAARKLARKRLGDVAQGVDVVQARKDERMKLTGLTFRDACLRYLAIHEKPTRYWREKRARLVSGDVKHLATLPIATMERVRIARAIVDVRKRSSSAARLLFADIRPIFAWALDQGIIDANPMLGMRGPATAQARDRVMTDEELRVLWRVLDAEGWPFGDAFKLLLLTGQRRDEVTGMRWREVNLDAQTWTIAKDRCKNGKAHTIDLCPEALRLVGARMPEDGARSHITGNRLVYTTTGQTPVSGYSRAKSRIDRKMKAELGDRFQPWRLHDLRRTAASGMAALGFQPHVIERVLNHVSGAQGGLVGVYQRHEYRDDRKRAILAWGEHVMALVADEEPKAENVVQLRRA